MELLARAKLNHLKSPFHFIPFWRRTWRSGGNALSIENLKIGSSLAGGIGAGNRAGTRDLTQIHSASGEEPGNRKTHRMAYFSPDLRNTSEERRHRIQGDARADAAFFAAIHAGHLCTSDYAGQARCASGCGVANVPSWVEQRSRFRLRGESDLIQSTGEKSQGGGHRWGAKVCPFCTPLCFFGIRVKFLF